MHADPTTTPIGINGKPLDTWQQVHDQFKSRLPRPGIDTDDRDIGAYPHVSPTASYQDRDYRLQWDDKTNRRMFEEPLPEQFDSLGMFMVQRSEYKMWWMLTAVSGFLGMFVGWWYVVKWWEERYGERKGPHPFSSNPRYTIKTAR